MRAVDRIAGPAIPWGAENIDTDIIIPARWLKTVTRAGLGAGAFEAVRAAADNPFAGHAEATILIAGANFGCGSSREHAAWAMMDMGLRAVIAPSFSDIFASNAFKNGLVTVELPQAAIDRLMVVAQTEAITIDLDSMTVTTPHQDRFTFTMDPFRRRCLREGLDEVALTMRSGPAIAAYETDAARDRPWLIPRGARLLQGT